MNNEKNKSVNYESSHEDNEVSPELNERQAEAIRQSLEKKIEQQSSKPEKLESIRKEALESASTAKHEENTVVNEKAGSPAERRKGPVTRKERDASFKHTLADAQTHMGMAGKTFSKIIHNKAVERSSEVVGSTIARPNAILAGSLFAFILTTGVLLIARFYGYPLSGFESIGAFVVGWVLGILYDFLRKMITGKS